VLSWRRLVSAISVTAVGTSAVVLPLTLGTAAPAHAWKPPTHLAGVEFALADATDGDGQLFIGPGGSTRIPVGMNPIIQQALTQYPKAYYAGTIGPDAFPDLPFGQTVIHPGDDSSADRKATTDAWLTHLWDKAWSRRLPSGGHDLEAIAFATGYLGGHAVGDTWAHTFINHFAHGVFPELTTHPEHAEISARHIVLEGYVDKHRPGYEAHSSFEIDAPTDFIAEALILDPFVKANGKYPLFDYFLDKKAGLATAEAEYAADNSTQDMVCALVCVPNPLDSPVNLIELGIDSIAESYTRAWKEDIDRGLRDWPKVWEVIAAELFTGKKPDLHVIGAALKDWILRDLLSMMGLPDFVGDGIAFIDGVLTEITTFVVDGILRPTLEFGESLPGVGPLIKKLHELISKARDFVVGKVTELADEAFGAFITVALGVTGADEATLRAVDKDKDGRVQPSEFLRLIQEPEEYLADPDLFPTSEYGSRNIRAELDAAMRLPAGSDVDGDNPDTPETEVENFRDYNIATFPALRDTEVMARMSLLDHTGLNTYLSKKVGPDANGNAVAVSVIADQPGDAPGNLMLGWLRSIDGDHAWRANSGFKHGGSYGKGTFALWEDCVLRDYVFRSVFAEPIPGVVTFGDTAGGVYSVPKALVDTTAPSISLAVAGGKSVSKDGVTYLTPETDLAYTAGDNIWPKDKVDVREARWRDGEAEPGLASVGSAASVSTFRLSGADGVQRLKFAAVDGYGRCVSSAAQTQTFSLDTTPPTLTVVSPAATQYTSDTFLPLDFTAVDPGGSGVDEATKAHTVDGTPVTPVPATIDLFDYPAGDHTYRASVADLLGNVGTSEVVFTTIVTHNSLGSNLTTAVSRGCVGAHLEPSLRTKLAQAAASDARGQDQASDNQLDAFRNEIAAPRGKGVSDYCAGILDRNAAALQAA
jgi:hypothetical protein